MMGRAGRPQFDDKAVACIFVHDVKKPFYKKFLYEPFPVESSLLDVCCYFFNLIFLYYLYYMKLYFYMIFFFAVSCH